MWIKLWTHRPYSPYLMYSTTISTVKKLQQIFPNNISTGGTYWENKQSEYFYVEKEIADAVEKLCAKGLKEPEFLFNVFKTAYQKAVAMQDFFEKIDLKNIESKPTEELLSYVYKFVEDFEEMYSFGCVPTLLGYKEENPLYQKMNEIMLEKTRNEPEKLADYLFALTSSPKLLLTQKNELEVLMLAKKARDNNAKTKQDLQKIYSIQLGELLEKYGHLSFDLCDVIMWDENYFADLVLEKIGLNLDEKIRELENYEESTEKHFQLTCEKLGFSEEEKRVFDLIRNIGYYKWAREHAFVKALYITKLVQDELGKRCGLTTLETKYLLASELRQAIVDPKKAKETAQKRFGNFLLMVSKKDGEAFFEGEKARQEYEKMVFLKQEINLQATSLRGTPACAGKVNGAVKIINSTSDVKKMRKGDVLVSVATNPDLLVAMKLAGAIVTSEGGITCHAAIVSRELRIPCVIGVKNASKILKEGELIQVDASKGVITRLQIN